LTGAGSSRVAFATEETFRELPGTPTWYQPGLDVSVGSVSLNNALQRSRQPDDARPAGSREGNLEGALSVSFALTDTNYHELVFANTAGDGLATEAALAPSATWYLEGDLPDGTEARILEGASVTNWTVNYNQGERVTVDLTITYTTEYDPSDTGAPATPGEGEISQPDKSDIIMWHGFDLDFATTNIEKLQSASIDVAGMAQPRRGQSRFIQDMVVGAYEPSLTFEGILSGGEKREYAYGSAGATTASSDTIGEQSATVTLGTLGTLSLSGVQPNSYDWQSLVSAENTTDPVEAQFTDVTFA